MFKFIKGTTATIICTLKEKQTIDSPYYLFVFTNRGTNDTVTFIKDYLHDVSTNKERWNEFTIPVNTYFADYKEGWWRYDIYEQTSSTTW